MLTFRIVGVGHFAVFVFMSYTWHIRPERMIYIPLAADESFFTSEGLPEVPE